MSNVADELAIRKVVAQYNRAFDYGDPVAWADLFTADGTFCMGGKELAGGKENLLAFAKKMVPSMKVKHCTTDAIVEVDGNTASHDAYLILVDTGADKVSVVNSGRYIDTMEKVGGDWKFKSRVVEIDGKM
ncbi:MAG: nuclear transport factor 2 family protein [Porticoccaceae bacterium]